MVDVAQEVQTPSGSISINGSYDSRFEGVFKAFEQNFAERGEVGAGVSVTWQGASVVDLWGGVADASGVMVARRSCMIWPDRSAEEERRGEVGDWTS